MAINKFVEVNRIKNVTAIQLGIWKEKGNMEIVLFRDYSSSNKLAPIFDASRLRARHIWGNERVETQAYRETIEVDTLDSIINKRIQKKIDYLNLTINGAEPEAIEGCSETINSINTISFPLRDIRSSIYENLKKENFNIAIADAPTKAWEDKPFLYACATRHKETELFKRGFKKATIEIIDGDLSPFPFKINYS